MIKMNIDIEVSAKLIDELAFKQLEKAGLDPSLFEVSYSRALRSGERDDGNVRAVEYTFKKKIVRG